MIVSVFVRRLKPGASFDDFIAEWAADKGFGVATRVFNAQSLDDPQNVISIGFVDVTPKEVRQWLAAGSTAEAVRHDRIDTVVESITLKGMFEVRTEHDFTRTPHEIALSSSDSLLHALAGGEEPRHG